MNRHYTLAISMIFLLITTAFSQPNECGAPPAGGNYSLIDAVDPLATPDRKDLFIYVKPQYFTILDMIKVINRLKYDYCGKEKLSVVLYKTKKPVASYLRPAHAIETAGQGSIRGYYTFDRDGMEELSFESVDKEYLRIVFDEEKYCVYRDK